MGSLTAFILSRFRQWDRPSQAAFLLAVGLLIPALIAASTGAENLRRPALFAVFGLLMMAQAIFMWANRGMVSPFTRAQRLYMRGDLDAARAILEDLRNQGKADMQALTLLGNLYRQLGLLDESTQVLYEAVNNSPNHYFSQYGFGRTLLVAGHYADAAEHIDQALADGAPPVVAVDAGEAYYRIGDFERARQRLIQAQPHAGAEPHRTLMTAYLLFRLDAGQPPHPALIHAGLEYWQAQAALFAHTPYGAALADDIRAMQALI